MPQREELTEFDSIGFHEETLELYQEYNQNIKSFRDPSGDGLQDKLLPGEDQRDEVYQEIQVLLNSFKNEISQTDSLASQSMSQMLNKLLQKNSKRI